MLPILVINLERSKARLEFMQNQLDEFGLRFERIPAVDGVQMNDVDFSRLSFESPIASAPDRIVAWTPCSVGCFLSHRQAWERAAQSDSPYPYTAILEDDLFLAADAVPLLSGYEWIPSGADLVRLETTSERVVLRWPGALIHDLPKEVAKRRSVYSLRMTTIYAGAYIISKDAAQRLLAVNKKEIDKVDFFLFSKRHSKISRSMNIFQVAPAVAIQGKFFQSNQIILTSTIECKPYKRRITERLYGLIPNVIKIARGAKFVRYAP
jgi:glycosyl transferase, family 25